MTVNDSLIQSSTSHRNRPGRYQGVLWLPPPLESILLEHCGPLSIYVPPAKTCSSGSPTCLPCHHTQSHAFHTERNK